MEKHGSLISFFAKTLNKTRKTLNEIFYGMTAYELEAELKKEKGNLNNLLMLVVFGDLVGLPLFPPYYSMRFLPYIVPFYKTWRRNILREKDLTDVVSADI
ncbi:MAG: hypothetical protein NTU69_10265 [Proteobacteria bacterium]|jgi:hypothetical protein|nr:hypothetical protein [Pseudomonadota bacterium]